MLDLMKHWISYAVGSAILVAGAARADDAHMTDAEVTAVQLALDRGLAIYRYDQAAWHTTDAALEDLESARQADVKGWVVTASGKDLLVTYWRSDGDGFRGVYSAIWDGSKVTDRKKLEGDAALMSTEQIQLIRAQQLIDVSKLERCSDAPFNSVVLPPTKPEEPILVYELTPQKTLSSIPMGGHYRFAVKDGKIVDQRAFTKSCLELALPDTTAEEKPVALAITHLLDPVPTEIHVFSVFASQVPIYVSTVSNKHIWATGVANGTPQVKLIQ